MVRRLACLLLCASGALAAAQPAAARVLNAEAVLPPGQSGFISTPGLASGSGSPHLYDQVELFKNFRWRPFTFGTSQGGEAESPRPGVTITRDAYGIPSVTAQDDAGLWFGAGYAVAQDRLFQLEAFRHATKGTLAELIGKSALQDDYVARRDYYTAAERARMLAALPDELRARFAHYRDGINAWIAEVQFNPSLLPGEFAATGELPIDAWTEDDSAAVGVFLARTVPSGDGRELANWKALRELGPKGFAKLLPLSVPGERRTVPVSERRFEGQGRRTRKQLAAAYKRTQKFLAGVPMPGENDPAAEVMPGALERRAALGARFAQLTGKRRGSYMVAVREPGKKALLFNGPQLGYSVPELFVELELHRPGLDVRGVTAPGVPVIGIGHNGNVAWGFTSGLSDEDDLFVEKLVPGSPEKYFHKGREREMECRNETFRYDSPPSDLLGGALPESGSVTKRICRTIHGPVQASADGVVFARRYAIWMRDVETLEGIARLNEAKSVYEVDAAMQKVTWNENVMAADSQGNIGYWHPGLFQRRPKGWDERLPYPGTGEAEWRGLIPRRRTPHVINPRQGWLANWNNVAAKGWTMGDSEATEKLSGAFHRSGWLFSLTKRLERSPSFPGLEGLVQDAGSIAQQRPLFSGRLARAAKGSGGNARKVLDALAAWDGSYNRTDAQGTVDPGVAIWEEFKDRAEEVALSKLGVKGKPGPGVSDLAGGTGSSHAFDISNGEAYALRTLRPADFRAAAEATFQKLAERFGSQDVGAWREPRRLYDVAAQGAGSVENFPFFDRGTWEQLLELGP